MTELKRFSAARNKGRGILLVSVESFSRGRRALPDLSGYHIVNFHDLDVETLHELAPETVISCAITRSFDCTDVAALLAEAGFSGRFCVIAEGIPDPGIIRDELLRQFPILDIELMDELSEQLDIAI